MRGYLSLLALGDNLISLSLLAQVDTNICVIGTKHTKQVAQLITENNNLIIDVIFDDIPAFYNIKKQGIIKSIKDFYIFIRYIQKSNIDELVFEKKDFRSSFVGFFTNVKIFYPKTTENNVYLNRKNLIESVYNQSLQLSFQQPNIDKNIILINPTTREKYRNITDSHLFCIVNLLKNNGYKIYLIDREKKYSQYKNDVDYYLTSTTLEDVKKLIQNCSLYIGGDSFLVHLAYHLQRPYFVMFYRDNHDFLPPNISKYYYLDAHNTNNIEQELSNKFKSIGLIDT